MLETAGFTVDLKESTRRAVKYRRGDDIIIVIHGGKGWFDPLSDAKGDVFRLVEHLDGLPFAATPHVVADLIGFTPSEVQWTRQAREKEPVQTVSQRWQNRRKPWRGSATWRYLHEARGIPEPVLRQAIAADLLREGPHCGKWAGHTDEIGRITGWEERGPMWRGFASGGAKVLFRLGSTDGTRFCVTEAAIDAVSLAAIGRLRPGSLYLSTGGVRSPRLTARPSPPTLYATDRSMKPNFRKILIANRGEIAIRTMRAANELGKKTVTVYAEEDKLSLHRFKADEACKAGEDLGPVAAYLSIPGTIRVAKECGADAIHPGYGLLSENPDFVDACAANGITFIGPKAATMRALGDKASARRMAIETGVPVIPATEALGNDFGQSFRRGGRDVPCQRPSCSVVSSIADPASSVFFAVAGFGRVVLLAMVLVTPDPDEPLSILSSSAPGLPFFWLVGG